MTVGTPVHAQGNPGVPGPNRALIAMLALVMVVAFGIAPGAHAQTVDSTMWTTNGTVNALAKGPGTIYAGGSFDLVGPSTGGGALLEADTGALPAGFPKVVGNVNVVIPDGSGGWYIGGNFRWVGGLPRQSAARINSDFSVSPWAPFRTDSGSPVVWALAAAATRAMAAPQARGRITNELLSFRL